MCVNIVSMSETNKTTTHTLMNQSFSIVRVLSCRHRSSSSQAKRSSHSSRGSHHLDSPLSFRGGKKEKGSGGGNKVGGLSGVGRSPTDVTVDGIRSNRRLVHDFSCHLTHNHPLNTRITFMKLLL